MPSMLDRMAEAMNTPDHEIAYGGTMLRPAAENTFVLTHLPSGIRVTGRGTNREALMRKLHAALALEQLRRPTPAMLRAVSGFTGGAPFGEVWDAVLDAATEE